MIKADPPLFGRVLTAMVTPFDKQSRLDLNAAERLVAHLLAGGTTAVVVSGTTGESPTLEESEKRELLQCVIAACKGKAKVIMGTGSNCTAHTIKATEEAEKLGADGALVVAPYYNKPNQAGLLAHFKEVAKSTSLPILVYNIPGRTGINILPETLLTIVEQHGNVIALKDSTGSTEQSAEIAGFAKSDFTIYSGDDYLTLPFLSIGGSGVVSVASHIVGPQIASMIEHFFAGRVFEARKLHSRYLPLFKGLFAQPNPTCVKYALSTLGLCEDTVRLPLVPLSSEQKKALDKILKEADLLTKTAVG